jgi:hypothetical protein
MTLREADSWFYLQLKAKMVESDHDAIFADGRILPVFIYQTDGQTKYTIEIDYKFFEAKSLPGFLRLEKQPDAHSAGVETPPVQSTKIQGSTWAEQKANAEMRGRKNLAEQHDSRKSQQGISAPDSAFAKASHAHAQAVASRVGQSGPNSKLQ